MTYPRIRPQPYYPTLDTLGLTDADLRAWGQSREAADRFVRGWLTGYSFEELLGGRQPRLSSRTFATDLASRVNGWMSVRKRQFFPTDG